MRFLSRTPVRTFLIYPLVVLLWELFTQAGRIEVNLWGLPLMIWGYLQYRYAVSIAARVAVVVLARKSPRRDWFLQASMLTPATPCISAMSFF